MPGGYSTQVPAESVSLTSQKKYSTWNPGANPQMSGCLCRWAIPQPSGSELSVKDGRLGHSQGVTALPDMECDPGECPSVSGCVPG